jgi:hypothetical protein
MNAKLLVAVFVSSGMLALATSASAECAWVLWSRINLARSDTWSEWSSGDSAYPTYSKCWAKIHTYTGISEEGSLVDWVDWMRGLGRYEMRRKHFLHLNEHELYTAATESGALSFVGKTGTEWRCLPDTVDPRGPKGK